MKTTRQGTGFYYATGFIYGNLVQYSIMQGAEGWHVTKTYGQGPEFYAPFKTKREALAALAAA